MTVLILGVALFPILQPSYGILGGYGEPLSSLQPNTFASRDNVLEFNNESDSVLACNVIVPETPEIKTRMIQDKNDRLSVDAYPNDLFIVLGELNSESFQYLQIPFQSDSSQPEHVYQSAIVDLKGPSEFESKYRLFQSEGTLAVVMESDTEFSFVQIPYSKDHLYKQYLSDSSRDESVDIRNRLGPGSYDVNAIVFLSDKKGWLEDETCAFSLNLKFSVGENGEISIDVPQIKTTKIREIRSQFSEEELEIMRGYYNGGFYADDGKSHPLSPLQVGQQVRLQEKVFNDLDSENLKGTLKFWIVEGHKGISGMDENSSRIVENLGTDKFDISPSTFSDLFSHVFVAKHSGDYMYAISYETEPNLYSGNASGTFSIVEKWGKSYEQNNGCKEDHRRIMKADFSTVVCATEDTHKRLLQRGGWHT